MEKYLNRLDDEKMFKRRKASSSRLSKKSAEKVTPGQFDYNPSERNKPKPKANFFNRPDRATDQDQANLASRPKIINYAEHKKRAAE